MRSALHASARSDAHWDIPDLLAAASARRLDFVTLTDHNTVSGLTDFDRLADDKLLTLGGMELTTFSLRIGDLARALRITAGATSKLVDRIEAAGLIRRELDVNDRRASRVALTDAGKHQLATASTTHEAEIATVLDAALSTVEQQRLHDLVTRLLAATK
jgi:DNA-binding MarR family transcriptional regulator